MKKNGLFLQLAMVAFKNGVPVFRFCDFGFIKKEETFVVVSDLKKINKIPTVYFMGINKEIRELTDSPDYFWNPDIKQNLIDLINIEARYHPNKIGAPVDVIVIYKNGHRWLTNNQY